MVEFIATHKDLHSIILVFEIIARIDCLWILNLLLQGDKVDPDRRRSDSNETVVQHTAVVNGFD